jgi:hypothetical protein
MEVNIVVLVPQFEIDFGIKTKKLGWKKPA